jgi:predicted Rossmann fold flavoprotein
MTCSTLIIGGGPAGLAAACFCAQPALVIERLAAPGRKLLATGGGRCNLTHATDAAGIMAAFGRDGRFMSRALAAFPPDAIRAFFASLGVMTRADPDGCVFPVSQRAEEVCRALEKAALNAGTELRCGLRAQRLLLAPDTDGSGTRRVTGVETARGILHARQVILAAGGQSYPALGSDGSGFALARDAGLDVTPPLPALAGLFTRETWPGTLAGLVLEYAALRLDAPGSPKTWLEGPVLFTHKGVSGPPALDLSGAINARLHAAQAPAVADVTVRLASRAGWTASDWRARFADWRLHHGGRALHNLLAGELPRALAATLCTLAGTENMAAARAPKSALEALADACAEQPLQITGTESWARAMVTCGGVSLRELDPRSLACRRRPGLFCAGEVVDLDGRCGGFNLTWALASGRLAGLATSA